MSKVPKLKCPVCGCRRGWLRKEFVPAGEWICADCGCFMKIVKPKKKVWREEEEE